MLVQHPSCFVPLPQLPSFLPSGQFDQISCCELFVGCWNSVGGRTCRQSEELLNLVFFFFFHLLSKTSQFKIVFLWNRSINYCYIAGCTRCSCGVIAHSSSCACRGICCICSGVHLKVLLLSLHVVLCCSCLFLHFLFFVFGS